MVPAMRAAHSTSDTWPRPRPFIVLALLTLHAALLSRDAAAPWVGMHDWNGAYYSCLARNMLRYPFEVTRGLPVVEMGPHPPPVDEAVRYATHPPGLIWLISGSFALFGVSEAAARLAPIVCSLASLWLLMRITAGTLGRATAMIAGLLYAVMPMTAFFGRMVDQEAVALCFMLASWWGWFAYHGEVATGRSRAYCLGVWALATLAAIWIDWPGVLSAGVVFLDAVRRRAGLRRHSPAASQHPPAPMARGSGRLVALAALLPAAGTAAVLMLLVYVGMNGSWAAMRDMAFSRAEGDAVENIDSIRRDRSMRGGGLQLTRDNFSDAVLVLACIGAAASLVGRRRARGAEDREQDSGIVEQQHAAANVPIAARLGTPNWIPFWVMTFVGGAWLALFWQQFLRHNYWQYYLAPTAVILAGVGVRAIHAGARRISDRLAQPTAVLILLATAGSSLVRVDDYFTRRSFSADYIRGWQDIASKLSPDESVALYGSFIEFDRRGAYSYRNLAPPHLVYYLDRKAVQVLNEAQARQALNTCSVLVIRADLIGAAEALLRLPELRDLPRYLVGPHLAVDLRPEHGRNLGQRLQ
ncbi:MAG: glycosyltransferase family 39 protein [Phycisphaerae bacterium]|nr:glycosyltransferase family 39 protein [Phycisphaerae bacterium]NUQ45614.1 glycosyltransferase family 39 protein [Phycisphaerae bacterium]